uniref:Uncharacterized protein n=1 Tax=Romanomermis culicivorax TaxID=13658 RepID=A0A915KEN5_ROMCU
MDLHPNLIRLIENCGIENVRAYPSISYDYILRLDMVHYRSIPIKTNFQSNFTSCE